METEPKRYVYNKMAGALQEAAAPPAPMRARHSRASGVAQSLIPEPQSNAGPPPQQQGTMSAHGHREALARRPDDGRDPTRPTRRPGMFFYTIDEGEHVLMTRRDGTMEELVGPKRVSTRGRTFRRMEHYVAHPGEFLVVRFRDGSQEHLTGPAHVWVDPRRHLSVIREEGLQLADKEAVVIYARSPAGEVSRRVLQGPAVFVTQPGEWLHTFSWHGSTGGSGYRKVPNAMVFQKLWLMPDQMYHDVEDVRTADDAVITVRLMIFFELVDIETMLATTHDPIGDFVNAATSDVVDFLGRNDLAAFKLHTDQLGELATYRQLTARAAQCGYRIGKVVYRGFDAPPSLQLLLDQAIESRTRLQLERATQQQAQELEDFKLERQLARGQRQRSDGASEQTHALTLEKARTAAALAAEAERAEFLRAQRSLDHEHALASERARHDEEARRLAALGALGVDLTALLTQQRADQVIELRGDPERAAHVHLEPSPRIKR